MFRVLGLFGLAVLCGCAQAQLEHQSDSFNRATANAISEHTLLNAVRSSLDMPMSFTKLLKFTASDLASGSISPKFPFGKDATRVFDFGPSIELSGGVGQIEYADANNSGALAKLNQNLQYDAFDRYVYQDLHPVLLMTLLVEHVEINSWLLVKMYEQRRKVCGSGRSPPLCEELDRIATLCKLPEQIFGGAFTLPGGYSTTTIDNRADTKCGFLKFQAFRYLVALSGYWSDALNVTTLSKLKTPEGTLFDVPKTRTGQVIGFVVPEMQASFDRIEKELENDFKRKKKAGKIVTQQHALRFAYRSPKSLLAYLGELIALQNFSRDKYVPSIVVGEERKEMTIFTVHRGGAADGKAAALSVRGPDGELYVVPQPKYGSEVRDQTLRVLAMAGELVNGALSEKDLPAPASVVVRAF